MPLTDKQLKVVSIFGLIYIMIGFKVFNKFLYVVIFPLSRAVKSVSVLLGLHNLTEFPIRPEVQMRLGVKIIVHPGFDIQVIKFYK